MVQSRNDRGQSTVEYILMLAVVASLAATILNSERFRKTLGKDSVLFNKFARTLEYTYRHGVYGTLDDTPRSPPFGNEHNTYYKGGQSRFYMSRTKYPE
ncbi:MAG: hypothetical protein A2X86_05970 [Bdellovibrionales bacterium GWA2_49_15]|nr:MAG: hypothetical protein A2X86_05970 [Bdellovibrionales bacterium GWA2_49_15]